MREKVSEALKKIKSTINYKLITECQNDQYKKYPVFDDLQDGSKQTSVAWFTIWHFDDVTTYMLDYIKIKNALSGIMANVLKFPWIYLVERIR